MKGGLDKFPGTLFLNAAGTFSIFMLDSTCCIVNEVRKGELTEKLVSVALLKQTCMGLRCYRKRCETVECEATN